MLAESIESIIKDYSPYLTLLMAQLLNKGVLIKS